MWLILLLLGIIFAIASVSIKLNNKGNKNKMNSFITIITISILLNSTSVFTFIKLFAK